MRRLLTVITRPVAEEAIRGYIEVVRGLPDRERVIYVAVMFKLAPPQEIADAHGLTTDEMTDLVANAIRNVSRVTR